MDRAREQLLARAALRLDEHGGVGARHAGDDREHLPHGRRVAEDVLEADVVFLGLEIALRVGLEGLQVGRARQHHLQRADVDGLGMKVERPQVNGLDRVDPVAVAGDHDDLGGRRLVDDLVERREPLFRAVFGGRQPQVEGDQVRLEAGDLGDGALTALRERQRELFAKRVFQLGADGLIVVDDEQLRLV